MSQNEEKKETQVLTKPKVDLDSLIKVKTDGLTVAGTSVTRRDDPLKVTGKRTLKVYQIKLEDGSESPAQRNFCGTCGSALWVFDPRWPEYVHPFASAIDTELPSTLERCHIMTDFAPKWVSIPGGKRNPHFAEYPDRSLEEWHRTRGLYDEN